MRKCYKCKKRKDDSLFYKRRSYSGGFRGECKVCSKLITKLYLEKNPGYAKKTDLKYRLTHKFKLTLKQYEELGEKNNWSCFICQKKQLDSKIRLAIDHDHITNKVRGLLCSKCNHGLGMFNDDKSLLRKAIQYLARY